MSYKGVLVLKQKDLLIPEQYLRLTLANNKTVVGSAVAVRDGSKRSLVIEGSNKALSEAELLAFQKEFESEAMLFHFGNYPEGFSEDDVQPFVLIQDNTNEALLACFAEGDFSGFAKEGELTSDILRCMDDYIRPTIKDLSDGVSGNIAKVLDKMRSPLFKRNIENCIATKGQVTFISVTGELMSFSKGQGLNQFPWGWTTNSYDYKEGLGTRPEAEAKKPETAAVADGSKKTSLKDRLAALAGGKPAKVEEPPFEADKPKTDVALPADATKGTALKQPESYAAKKTWSNGDKKNFYRDYFGFIPKDWKECPKLPASQLKKPIAIKTLQDLGLYVADTKSITEKKAEVVQDAGSPAKDVEAKHVKPDNVPITSDQRIMSAETKLEIKELFVEGIVKTAKMEVLDVDSLEKMEKKFPTFFEQAGIDFETCFKWPRSVFIELATNWPEAAGNALFDFRNAILKDRMKEGEQPAELPADTPVEEEVPQQEQTETLTPQQQKIAALRARLGKKAA